MEISTIKQQLSILQVLHHYGLSPDKNNRLHCPFHDDKTPSMQVYPETNTVYCFSSNCKTHGKAIDVIDFIMYKEALTGSASDKHAAIKKAESMLAHTDITPSTKVPVQEEAINTQILSKIFNYFRNGFIMRKDNKARTYLQGRKLDVSKLENLGISIGYNSAQFHHRERITPEDMQACEQSGLLIKSTSGSKTAYSYMPWASYCVIFPLVDEKGNITGMYGRSTADNTTNKHYYLKNSKGLFYYPKSDTKQLIITESIIDFLSLYQIDDLRSRYDFLPIYGTNRLNEEHKKAISKLHHLEEIIFFLDGDKAGEAAVKKYGRELLMINDKWLISQVETPENEDINSLLQAHEPEIFPHLLENRLFLFSTENKKYNEPDEPDELNKLNKLNELKELNELKKLNKLNETPHSAELNTKNPYKLRYTTDTANYYIQGGISKMLDSMKTTIVIENPQTQQKARNKTDLYEDKQVEKLCKDVSEKLNLRKDLLESDINNLTDLLDEYRETELLKYKQDEGIQGENQSYAMTQQEINQAIDTLKQADLIPHICAMLGQAGIVGEEKNRIFLFVSVVSHIMKETLHVLIQGSSGSGKTRQLRIISDCMPQERVIRLTRVSDKSFYNYPENYLSHKIISLEDVDGLSEEAEFAYRELVSNGELRSSISIKEENGRINSGHKIVKGPIASLACTTNGSVYEDNISRMFIVAVDESREQTQRIMSYQNAKSAGKIDSKKENDIKRQLQHVVRMLKPLPVVNHYADQIHLPEEAHKLRRLNDLFKIFIHQITLINQYQRKKDEQGRLISTLEDVEIAIDIMFDSIILKVDELDGSLRQFYEKLKEYIRKVSKDRHSEYQFMQREIRQALSISKTQLYRYLNDLAELEYIQQSGGFANKGYKYKIVYWDDYKALRERIKKHLYEQLKRLTK